MNHRDLSRVISRAASFSPMEDLMRDVKDRKEYDVVPGSVEEGITVIGREEADEDSPLLATREYSSKQELQAQPKRRRCCCPSIPWQEMITVLLAAFTPLARGFITGFTSPTVEGFHEAGMLTDTDAAWFGSLVNFGGIASCFFGTFFMELVGRRGTLMGAALVQIVGWGCIIFASKREPLIIGRLLSGFGSAVVFSAFSIYIAEITYKSRRGMLTSVGELFITVGTTLAYFLGQYMTSQYLAGVGCGLSSCMLVVMLALPESPRWLISKARFNQAMKNLSWLRGMSSKRRPILVHEAEAQGHDGIKTDLYTSPVGSVEREIREEYEEIRAKLSESKDNPSFCNGGYKELPTIKRPLLICMGMMALQGIGGSVAVVAFMQTIFHEARFPYAGHATVVVGGVRIIATLTAGSLVDRIGRKKLLIIGGLCQAASMTALAIAFFTQHELPSNFVMGLTGFLNETTASTQDMWTTASPFNLSLNSTALLPPTMSAGFTWVFVIFVATFLFSYSLGWGTVPSVVQSEMFPQRQRSLAGSLISLCGLSTGTVCAFVFTPITAKYGMGAAFILYATAGLAGVIYVTFLLPETKNRSLEELNEVLRGRGRNEEEEGDEEERVPIIVSSSPSYR